MKLSSIENLYKQNETILAKMTEKMKSKFQEILKITQETVQTYI